MKLTMQQLMEIPNLRFSRQGTQTRYKLLAQVQKELESRHRQSLHKAVLAENPQLESLRLWQVEVKIGNLPSELLPPQKPLIELFDLPAVAGKLLILGAAGSGKTSSLLELSEELIARAVNDASKPVPVLLNLASWHQQQSIAEWIALELQSKYGLLRSTGHRWLHNYQILPCLDGLSELKPEGQKPCLQAINEFIETVQSQHLVVCCGVSEYATAKILLQLNAAIYLQPLNESQIYDYLSRLPLSPLNQGSWGHGHQLQSCLGLLDFIRNDPHLLNWAKTPLFLNLIILAAEEIYLDEWRMRTSPESRCRYLLDAYIRRQLKQQIASKWAGRVLPPTPEQTKQWLGWLAKWLKRESQEEFCIENIQPDWLPVPSNRWLYRLGVGLIVGGIGAVSAALSFGPVAGIFIGLFFGCLGGLSFKIEPVEPINWSWEKAVRGLFIGGSLGLGLGLFGGLFLWLVGQLSDGLLGAGRAMLGVFIGGLIFGATQGLDDPEIKPKLMPNQGIWQSAYTAGIFTLISGVTFGLSFGLIGGFVRGIGGFGFGVLVGLACGGIACIQHLVLRLILWSGGYSPWNYAAFLNYARSLMFLQASGGRYRFTHDLLKANFAAPPLAEMVLRKTSGGVANTVAGHSDYIQAVAIAPNGQVVVSGSDDRTLKLWQIVPGEAGKMELRPLCTLAGHSGYVRTVSISPDGEFVASGSNDKTIKIWQLSNGSYSGIPQGTLLATLTGHSNWVRAVVFSPDGQFLASAGDDKMINIWYLRTGQLFSAMAGHSDYIRCLAFSPDGKFLASGGDDKTINIWELDSGGFTGTFPVLTLEGHSGYVRSLAMSPNGEFLVSGSDDQTITVWQLASGNPQHPVGSPIHLLGGHSSLVWSVAISPDGKVLATCSKDKTIKLWRLETGELLRTISLGAAAMFALVFTPDGRYLLGGSQDRTVKVLPVNG